MPTGTNRNHKNFSHDSQTLKRSEHEIPDYKAEKKFDVSYSTVLSVSKLYIVDDDRIINECGATGRMRTVR